MKLSEVSEYSGFEIIKNIRPVRNTRIHIKPEGKIVVVGKNAELIQQFLDAKSKWITNKVNQIKSISNKHNLPENKIPFFGKFYNMGNFKKMNVSDLRKTFRDTLKVNAEAYLSQTTKSKIKVRVWAMKRKLGSFSRRKNEMHLSVYLAFLPKHLVEYVIFHEYAHTLERSHNKKFYRIIEMRFPFRKALDLELRKWWLLKDKILRKYDFSKSI